MFFVLLPLALRAALSCTDVSGLTPDARGRLLSDRGLPPDVLDAVKERRVGVRKHIRVFADHKPFALFALRYNATDAVVLAQFRFHAALAGDLRARGVFPFVASCWTAGASAHLLLAAERPLTPFTAPNRVALIAALRPLRVLEALGAVLTAAPAHALLTADGAPVLAPPALALLFRAGAPCYVYAYLPFAERNFAPDHRPRPDSAADIRCAVLEARAAWGPPVAAAVLARLAHALPSVDAGLRPQLERLGAPGRDAPLSFSFDELEQLLHGMGPLPGRLAREDWVRDARTVLRFYGSLVLGEDWAGRLRALPPRLGEYAPVVEPPVEELGGVARLL